MFLEALYKNGAVVVNISMAVIISNLINTTQSLHSLTTLLGTPVKLLANQIVSQASGSN